MQEVWVQSLVEELRSHMTQGQKKQNVKQTQYCNKFNKDLDKKVYVLSMCTVQGMVNYHTKYSKQESTLSWQWKILIRKQHTGKTPSPRASNIPNWIHTRSFIN